MEYSRADRVAHLIKRVVAEMLATEIKDPRIGMVTITDVTVSRDLRTAHIYYSTLGSEEQRRVSSQGLCQATPFIQRELGHRVRLRYTPEIDFRFDSSMDYGSHIEKLLHDIDDHHEPHDEEAQNVSEDHDLPDETPE